MLTVDTPAEIKSDLVFKGPDGAERTLKLTYVNRSPDEYDAFVNNPESMKAPSELTKQVDVTRHVEVTFCLFVVKSFDDGTDSQFPVTYDGLWKLDRYWPNVLTGIARGYHLARNSSLEKN